MTNVEYIQIEINLLHKQLDAKQSELDAKYEERNKILRKERNDCNISKAFQEDAINDMTNNCEDLYGDENFDFI